MKQIHQVPSRKRLSLAATIGAAYIGHVLVKLLSGLPEGHGFSVPEVGVSTRFGEPVCRVPTFFFRSLGWLAMVKGVIERGNEYLT
jgi:hypothetical protein